jgi:hypothetical protein
MFGPSHEQLAYFLTRGRQEEYDRKPEPSSDVVNRYRCEHMAECKGMSNPEIIKRYFQ